MLLTLLEFTVFKTNMNRQDSLTDQMKSVLKLATEAGCYDAADWIKEVFFKYDPYTNKHKEI